ncbi:LysM peptidoglycan-binding domain-containing protein [Lysobacter solisilvae]|uniref:LysM peptidoglycan-binding domain-containing protein n=2 Tax=Agrilutibacter solisilvae TaxID=2763317 RepID=A0A974Y3M7_9GAMM|nr:LysM peptidoglycan-binding domain-containing protein [Lysobacter solisilvae]
MRPVVKAIAGTVLALMAALASFSAAALGLGQIEVKSSLGQPLLAEIPIVTSDPTELEQLQAVLASPETFARIGMLPPTGVVADLRFTQALDARGNPIIRVTSVAPVTEPLLTFLVEVDWGQGRLVREYSALVDTPRTVSAPLQPSIQAPSVEAPAVIERPAAAPPPAAEDIAAEELPPEEVSADGAAPSDAPAPSPDAIAASPDIPPPPVATPVPSPVAPSPTEAGELQVRPGDTLSTIAGRVGQGGTLDQTMIALLRANPEAFIDGNINRLRAGAVLRAPGGDALNELDPRQASAIVNAQMQEWRDARRAVPQPALDAEPARPAAIRNTATPAAAGAAAPRVAGARLEIVPPGASDATRAGTQSGVSAGGEGAMLQQELVQTKETLAAREAEAQELKSRVAELEKLRQQQDQLIQMKDSELAAAQQRLAQAQSEQTQASLMPWVFAGVAALALGLLMAWVMRRRDQSAPKFRNPATVPAPAPSIADAFGPTVGAAAVAAEPERAPEPEPEPEPELVLEPDPVQPPPPVRKPEAPRTAVPAWHTGNTPAQQRPDPGAQAAYERIELAQAYLDVGDMASARQLLGEVVINGDHAARQQASRMLRELE